MPLGVGETFAGYRVVRRLGAGGMGEVYLVEHPRLPRRDALKLLAGNVSTDDSFRLWRNGSRNSTGCSSGR